MPRASLLFICMRGTEAYIVSSILKERGIKIWVEGYVMLLGNNSPVDDKMILRNISEIDYAIHESTER